MTQVVARRVAELRKAAGLNQADLGERMAELRPGWSRSTVVKLENLNRESLSVSDLLALAVVLDVPPVWLLADPKSEDPVPVAPGVTLDPWTALLWFVGREPIEDVPGSRYEAARAALVQVQLVAQALAAIRATEEIRAAGGGLLEKERAAEDERHLRQLAAPLTRLVEWGYPAPQLPSSVVKRARQLDVELPGQGG